MTTTIETSRYVVSGTNPKLIQWAAFCWLKLLGLGQFKVPVFQSLEHVEKWASAMADADDRAPEEGVVSVERPWPGLPVVRLEWQNVGDDGQIVVESLVRAMAYQTTDNRLAIVCTFPDVGFVPPQDVLAWADQHGPTDEW
jgi:hypothetical protein